MRKTTSLLTRLRRLHLLRWSLVCAALPLASCQGVLDPQGPIASAERLLLINSTSIMLVVVIPVIVATLAFAWWYRSSNTHATRSLDESYEGRVEFVVWSIPTDAYSTAFSSAATLALAAGILGSAPPH
jgi:heme/copper-type cytochrome/quinol oxidase subunit 2